MKFLLFVATIAVASGLLLQQDSCGNRCFMANDYMRTCQCDSDCETFTTCCTDFWRRCRGTEEGLVVTQQELNTFAQSLWDNDVNRIDNALYSLNYQGQINPTTTSDLAVNPLIQPTDGQLDAKLASSNSTYNSFIQLLDNYELNIHSAEHRPMTEIQEENAFWSVASQTQDMQLTFQFLRDNGFIKGDPHAFRTVINELWFVYYMARQGSHAQTGFESLIVGEKSHIRGNKHHNASDHLSGFNNWVRFYLEQKAGSLDYQGYINYLQDPPIVNVQFLWNNTLAHGKSFFVGTSPEFDMGLITVCGLARRNKPCEVTINGQTVTLTVSVALHKEVLQLTGVQIHFPSNTAQALNMVQ